MAIDDTSGPGPDAAIDAADEAYQRGFDDARALHSLVRICLEVLKADIDAGPKGTLVYAAVEDMRAAAAGRIARTMRLDIEPAGP